jgi:MFS family permease
LGGPRDTAETSTEERTSRKFLWVEGLLSNASESFVGTFLAPFALALGASTTQIGSLASTTNIASAIGLLPGAKFEECFGCRKRIFLACTGIFGRLFLLGLVFLPFLFHASFIFYGLLAVVAARGFLNQFSYPAWSALVTDLVPEKMRGRYFGSRNMAVGLAALICTPLAGYIIKEAGPRGYTFSFAIAAGIGFVATVAFGLIKEPRKAHLHEEKKKTRVGFLSVFVKHPQFAAFTGIGFLLHLSLQVSGPFSAVYQIQRFGANTAHIGILASVGALTGMIGQRVWGAQNDRRGDAWVVRVTHFLIPCTSFAWAIIPSWSYLPFVEAVSGFAWAGYWLSNFNLLVRMVPEENRSRYVAVYQSVVSIASFIGPVLGGMLVSLVSLAGLFWISAIGRLVVAILFVLLVEGARTGIGSTEKAIGAENVL